MAFLKNWLHLPVSGTTHEKSSVSTLFPKPHAYNEPKSTQHEIIKSGGYLNMTNVMIQNLIIISSLLNTETFCLEKLHSKPLATSDLKYRPMDNSFPFSDI